VSLLAMTASPLTVPLTRCIRALPYYPPGYGFKASINRMAEFREYGRIHGHDEEEPTLSEPNGKPAYNVSGPQSTIAEPCTSWQPLSPKSIPDVVPISFCFLLC
jgi:hypothetical protein